MLKEKRGLSEEKDTSRQRVIRPFFPENHIVTDQMVGQSWDGVADLWSEGYSEFGNMNGQYIIEPALFRALGEVKRKRVLDAGYGNAYLC